MRGRHEARRTLRSHCWNGIRRRAAATACFMPVTRRDRGSYSAGLRDDLERQAASNYLISGTHRPCGTVWQGSTTNRSGLDAWWRLYAPRTIYYSHRRGYNRAAARLGRIASRCAGGFLGILRAPDGSPHRVVIFTSFSRTGSLVKFSSSTTCRSLSNRMRVATDILPCPRPFLSTSISISVKG